MMGGSGGARDSSFLCLLAIYAAHVFLYHVLDPVIQPKEWTGLEVTSRGRLEVLRRNGTSKGANRTAEPFRRADLLRTEDIFAGELRHEVFARSSQLHLDSSVDHPIINYPKINLDLLFLLRWIHRVKNIFTIVALSSSTWGIISGCAIFLLTYTDRDNTLQT